MAADFASLRLFASAAAVAAAAIASASFLYLPGFICTFICAAASGFTQSAGRGGGPSSCGLYQIERPVKELWKYSLPPFVT